MAKKSKVTEKNVENLSDQEQTIEVEILDPEEGQGNEIEIEVPDSQSGKSKKKSKKEEGKEALKAELKQAQIALQEANDQYLRLNADFINFRKRKDKEMTDVVRFANQDLLAQLLPILDNFGRTLEAMDKTDNMAAIKDGIAGVSRNMNNIFTKIGLEPIEAIGQPFDSELHEAITTIPVEDEEKKDKVVDEVEKGYKLKDKVIRFSKVVVGE